ncbi:uncharacterized protein LY89DRAFT_683877, partial [Mollisia scopiformis]
MPPPSEDEPQVGVQRFGSESDFEEKNVEKDSDSSPSQSASSSPPHEDFFSLCHPDLKIEIVQRDAAKMLEEVQTILADGETSHGIPTTSDQIERLHQAEGTLNKLLSKTCPSLSSKLNMLALASGVSSCDPVFEIPLGREVNSKATPPPNTPQVSTQDLEDSMASIALSTEEVATTPVQELMDERKRFAVTMQEYAIRLETGRLKGFVEYVTSIVHPMTDVFAEFDRFMRTVEMA